MQLRLARCPRLCPHNRLGAKAKNMNTKTERMYLLFVTRSDYLFDMAVYHAKLFSITSSLGGVFRFNINALISVTNKPAGITSE